MAIGSLSLIEQQKSKLVKHGPGKIHEKAKDRLVNILMDLGWEVLPDSKMQCVLMFNSEAGESLLESEITPHISGKAYIHTFDVYARKESRHGIKSELFAEIDGKVHNSKPQQNRDKTAQHYAEFFFPNAKFKRIPISELLGDADDKSIVDFYGLK